MTVYDAKGQPVGKPEPVYPCTECGKPSDFAIFGAARGKGPTTPVLADACLEHLGNVLTIVMDDRPYRRYILVRAGAQP